MVEGYSEIVMGRMVDAQRGSDTYDLGELKKIFGVAISLNTQSMKCKVGDKLLSVRDLESKLLEISSPEKTYNYGFYINEDIYTGVSGVDSMGIIVIGRQIPYRLEFSGKDEIGARVAYSLVGQRELRETLNQSEEIVKDLRRLGLPEDIEVEDLVLYIGYRADDSN